MTKYICETQEEFEAMALEGTIRPILPDGFFRMSLDTAYQQYRNGQLSQKEWNTYAHHWQTSAPRFAIRACQCHECVKNYPSPEFAPIA
jgi:hypothetical protein